jgi:hypothetical protein
MNAVFERIRAAGVHAWLKLLGRLNAVIGVVCAGIVMLNQTNPGVVQTLIAKLSPTQQALAALAFCSLVQYAIARAKKAA